MLLSVGLKSFVIGISTGILLFGFLFVIYSMTTSGIIRYGDEAERYLQAQSIVEQHTLEIRSIPGHQRIAPNGKVYSQFEMGFGLLLVPAYWIGMLIAAAVHSPEGDWIPLQVVFLVNPLLSALTGGLLYRTSKLLGATSRAAFLTTIVFAFGTMTFSYSKGLTREPFQALVLLLSFYFAMVYRQTKRAGWLWLVAWTFGYLVFAKVSNLIMLPVFGAYIAMTPFYGAIRHKMDSFNWLPTLRILTILVIPLVILMVIQGLVNLYKFEDFWDIGPENYRNPLPYLSIGLIADGFKTLFLDADKSLFVHAPPVWLFVPAWLALARRRIGDAIFLLALVVVNIVFLGMYSFGPAGTWNLGPRYLDPILPLLMLPLGILLDSSQRWLKALVLIALSATFIAGLQVQVPAVMTDDRAIIDFTQNTALWRFSVDFFQHRALDSLFINASSIDSSIQIRPFFWLSSGLALAFMFVILLRVRLGPSQPHANKLGLGLFMLVMGVFVLGWILEVGLHRHEILAQKADSMQSAGNLYSAEGRSCEAQAMYLRALYLESPRARAIKTKIEQISPMAAGDLFEDANKFVSTNPPNSFKMEPDQLVSISGNPSLRVQTKTARETTAEINSAFIDVDPETAVEFSGWLNTAGSAGGGFVWIGWYEDNGEWQSSRSLGLMNVHETRGWQPFRFKITTLPSTKRFLIKIGVNEKYGSFWLDDLKVVQIEGEQPQSLCAR